MPSSGKTGENCTVSGVYQADCGPGHTHRFDPGDKFTPCTYCQRSVTWTWIRSL